MPSAWPGRPRRGEDWLAYLSSAGDASEGEQAGKHAAWEAATLHQALTQHSSATGRRRACIESGSHHLLGQRISLSHNPLVVGSHPLAQGLAAAWQKIMRQMHFCKVMLMDCLSLHLRAVSCSASLMLACKVVSPRTLA